MANGIVGGIATRRRATVMFSWTRGQQIVAIGAIAAIVAASGYIGLRRLRALPEPAEEQFFTQAAQEEAVGHIIVHVSGHVVQPGAYTLPADARVQDAIAAAGGAMPDADLGAVNLAAFLADGDKVTVPSRTQPGASRRQNPGTPATVNINKASAAEFEQLPGVGPKIAEEIILYRERHGNFTRLEQLESVPGIGDKKFEQIRPLISL